MINKIENLVEKIKALESLLILELQKKEKEFFYVVAKKKVRFEREVRKHHKTLLKTIRRYIQDAAFLNILTAPVIWFCLIPGALLDLSITVYQKICFPVYKIPQVKRSDYIVIDRQNLSYLNGIEKFNCVYCGYFNGLVAYVQEVVARTEQYWCPIKHARKLKTVHNRYRNFIDFGDADSYLKNIEKVRRDFKDVN
ncbi:hypothetical protein MNBD_NITROSPINAE05-331 [hydrothermal vent metagenome]|uniref:Uncharacterized protein n=1 Tax=hydrothermal vent metagenome TaxID=652676 RepID=A0A3B1DGA2_9ZZZZ